MDITTHVPVLARSRDQVQELMGGTSTVACFGSRALLSLFVAAAPYPESLQGAVTTEEEALELIQRHRPTFLFATETLEAGDGLSLVRHAHAELPDLRTLLILQSSSIEALRRGDCLGLVPAAIAPKQLA